MYALVEIKGKQYKAEKGSSLKVDKLSLEAGEAVEFDKVLMISDDKAVKVGSPYLKGASVKATVAETKQDKKVLVFKFKKRKNYKRTKGHRQQYTFINVVDIVGA